MKVLVLQAHQLLLLHVAEILQLTLLVIIIRPTATYLKVMQSNFTKIDITDFFYFSKTILILSYKYTQQFNRRNKKMTLQPQQQVAKHTLYFLPLRLAVISAPGTSGSTR